MSETLRAIVRLGEGFAADGSIRQHRVRFDVPARTGGADTGPTPEETVLDALGACTAMTLAMYGRRKGWDVAGITVDVAMNADGITRSIAVSGDLDADQLARLLEIANKCPVHRMLTKPPATVSTIAKG